MTAEQNLLLLREIEANRRFLLLAYASNPALLARAEPRIRQLFDALPAKTIDRPPGDPEGAG